MKFYCIFKKILIIKKYLEEQNVYTYKHGCNPPTQWRYPIDSVVGAGGKNNMFRTDWDVKTSEDVGKYLEEKYTTLDTLRIFENCDPRTNCQVENVTEWVKIKS